MCQKDLPDRPWPAGPLPGAEDPSTSCAHAAAHLVRRWAMGSRHWVAELLVRGGWQPGVADLGEALAPAGSLLRFFDGSRSRSFGRPRITHRPCPGPSLSCLLMAQIRYQAGDATSPQAKGTKVIAHICNDQGGWGKGFVLAVSRRWPEPEAAYRRWHRGRAGNDFGLGATQLVQVTPDIWVANMIGQHGIKTGRSSGPPIRYEAVRLCLCHLAGSAVELAASVHMPRIGCGLAGGRWDRIEPLITSELIGYGVSVTVYDQP